MRRPSYPPQRVRTMHVFVAAFACFLALGVSWALASPVFSVPDENAHAGKALATTLGELTGKLDPAGVTYVDLPEGFTYSPTAMCFAYDADHPADCGFSVGDPGDDFIVSWVANYNPLYYVLVSLPTYVVKGEAGFYAMRFVSAALSALLCAATLAVAHGARRARPLYLGIGILSAPMMTYFAGAVNPQGIEIASAAAVAVTALLVLDPDRQEPARALWWIVHAIGAVILLNARASGPLWYVVVLATVTVGTGVRPWLRAIRARSSWPAITTVAMGAGFAAWWLLHVGQLTQQARQGDAPLVGGSIVSVASAMVRNTPLYVEQAAGYFGWLDTRLPPALLGLGLIGLALPILTALLVAPRAGVVRIAALLAIGLVVPVVVQTASASHTGIIWQGRYGLFEYVAIVLVSCWIAGPHLGSISPTRVTALTLGITSVYSALAFVFVLARYSIGEDGSATTLLTSPAWSPPSGTITVALLHVTALLGLISLLVSVSSGAEQGRRLRSEAAATGAGGVE